MREININTWNRKQHFNHFSGLADASFAVTIPFDVTKAYQFSKKKNLSFFAKYLHDCMKTINAVENLKYRIIDGKIVEYDIIHASPTLMRTDKTFGIWIAFRQIIENIIINSPASIIAFPIVASGSTLDAITISSNHLMILITMGGDCVISYCAIYAIVRIN